MLVSIAVQAGSSRWTTWQLWTGYTSLLSSAYKLHVFRAVGPKVG